MAAGSDDVVEPSVEEGEDEEEEVNPIMAEVLEAAENGDVDALAELLSKVCMRHSGVHSFVLAPRPSSSILFFDKHVFTEPGPCSQVGVNDKGEDGDTALNIACLYGQKAVVQELLRRCVRSPHSVVYSPSVSYPL
eukprot:scaffold125894_cov39-Tisochrysis_lutea.AAC.1